MSRKRTITPRVRSDPDTAMAEMFCPRKSGYGWAVAPDEIGPQIRNHFIFLFCRTKGPRAKKTRHKLKICCAT